MCFPKFATSPAARFVVQSTVDVQKDPAGFSSVNQYLVEDKISSHVKKILDLDTGSDYALKVFRRKNEYELFSREIECAEKIPAHEHIIKFQEAIDDPSHSKTFIVMEYAEGGQITNVDARTGLCDRKYSSDEAADKIRELAEGVYHMHSHGVIHRDLKPENVLLDNQGRVKIADFGECAFFEAGDDRVDGAGRTVAYSCPEGFSCDEYRGKPADVWGIGVVAYCILFGHLPFWGDSHSQIMHNVLNKTVDIPSSASPQLRNFMSRVFEKDPSKRITVAQILSHPWITGQPVLCPSPPTMPRQSTALSPRAFLALRRDDIKIDTSNLSSPRCGANNASLVIAAAIPTSPKSALLSLPSIRRPAAICVA